MLPWGRDRGQLQLLTRATVERLRTSNDEGKRAFIRELADAVAEPGLREKVVLDMAAIAAADQVATGVERTTIGAFILAFGLDPKTMMDSAASVSMRAKISVRYWRTRRLMFSAFSVTRGWVAIR